jgi:hypothetical protein
MLIAVRLNSRVTEAARSISSPQPLSPKSNNSKSTSNAQNKKEQSNEMTALFFIINYYN